jgi:hypothetical protein
VNRTNRFFLNLKPGIWESLFEIVGHILGLLPIGVVFLGGGWGFHFEKAHDNLFIWLDLY